MRVPKVSIAHSGRQHVHQTVYGLAQAKMLDRFYTPQYSIVLSTGRGKDSPTYQRRSLPRLSQA